MKDKLLGSTRNANRRRRMLLLSPNVSNDDASDADIPARGAARPAAHKFREACGATGPIELRVTGPGLHVPRDFVFEAPFVVIGRSRRADLRLNHPDVSLRHTYLQIVGGRVYCFDLESRTGTARDHTSNHQGEEIEEGTALDIGPYHVEVIAANSGDEPERIDVAEEPGESESSADELIRANVEVLNCRNNHQRFRPVEEGITLVGNARGSHLRLKDSSVSKTHCALVRTAEALWCVDLLGRGGTRLNGAEIRIGRLNDGDLLHVGKAKLRVHYSTMADPLQTESATMPQPTAEPTSAAAVATEEPPSPAANDPASPAAPPTSNMPALGMPAIPGMPMMPAPVMPPQLPQVAGNSESERNVSEAFVLSLVNRFGEMQQQLYQQSQQSMMMLVNMFSNLHQNHMELIRDDLNRLHEITAELQSVQAQMAAGQNSATNVSYTRDPHPAESYDDAEIHDAQPEPVPPPRSERTDHPAAPAAATTDAEATPNAPGPSPEEDPNRRRPDRSGVRTHAMLTERLAELETERNSRWQKILQTLTGSGGA